MKKETIIAFYLPQYHPTPENDKWWGKGFTEWTNVGKALPLFKGHYQPKVPADLGYYDLRIPEVRCQQVELAKEAGVDGFCYWHYWFGGEGRQLLNEIIDEVHATGEPDFPFCLGWANESWKKKQWNVDGFGDETLMEQRYEGVEDYTAHFNYVLNLFKDARYIKIENKPLFYVYKPLQHPEMKEFIELWNELAKKEGFDGVYFVGKLVFEKDIDVLLSWGFDCVTFDRIDGIIKRKSKTYRLFINYFYKILNRHIHVRYKNAFPYFTRPEIDCKEYVAPSLIPNWDHSPRSKNKGFLLHDAKPEYFEEHAKNVLNLVSKKNNKLIFLKSWNEWGEGNYMEPDLKYGKGYIEALRRAINFQK